LSDINQFALNRKQVRQSFESAADSYDDAAVLQREIGERLISRLDLVNVQPQRVLDLGAGTCRFSEKLQHRYKKSEVWSVDFAGSMLAKAPARSRWRRQPKRVCADALNLPCGEASFDLIFSNLMLQWCLPLDQYFSEIRRVLRPGGVFLFSTFGPDTLKELRAAWAAVDDSAHVHAFLDMHDVGDALLRVGFSEPVVDMEVLTLTYGDFLAVMKDLKAIGARNAAESRSRGLLGRRKLWQLEEAYERFRGADQRWPATYEVVYGIAWASSVPTPSSSPQSYIPVLPGT
jgi:malonyl-CoA O-methyltransferase